MADAAPYPWLTEAWDRLAALLAAGRLPHAVLLNGRSGLGKRDFALAFAARVLCDGQTGCGKCRSCDLLAAGTHPDLRVLERLVDDGGKQSRFIVVDQVRECIEFLTTTAHRTGGWRVVVVEPAETLNAQAANALLKTLEEPGPDTLLLLVAHQPALLPPTIRSRCMSVPFHPVDAAAIGAWLGREVDAAQVDVAAGAPLRVAELVEDEAPDTAWAAGVAALRSGAAAPEIVDRWLDALDGPGVLDRLLLQLRRDLGAHLGAADAAEVVLAPRAAPPQIAGWLELLTEGKREFLSPSNINERLWLEAFVAEHLGSA